MGDWPNDIYYVALQYSEATERQRHGKVRVQKIAKLTCFRGK